MENQEFDQTFGIHEQAEILRLAGRLQEAHRDRMTLGQIEALASEAGIEPKFVKLAAQSVQSHPKAQDRLEVTPPLAVSKLPRIEIGIIFFLLFQLSLIIQVLFFRPYGALVGMPAVLLASVFLGVTFSDKPKGVWRALSILVGSSAFFSLTIALLTIVVNGHFESSFWTIPLTVAIQSVLVFAGSHFGRILKGGLLRRIVLRP